MNDGAPFIIDMRIVKLQTKANDHRFWEKPEEVNRWF